MIGCDLRELEQTLHNGVMGESAAFGVIGRNGLFLFFFHDFINRDESLIVFRYGAESIEILLEVANFLIDFVEIEFRTPEIHRLHSNPIFYI